MELHSLLRVVKNHLNPLDGMDCPRDASKVCGNAKRVESHEAGSAGFDQRKNKEIQGCQILQAKDLHAIGDPKGSCLNNDFGQSTTTPQTVKYPDMFA
jgi:hypothetical protein